MDHYPKRTSESDNKAKAIKVALDSHKNAPVNYMIAVAVTETGICFIATSGKELSRIEQELKASFHWFRLFKESAETFGTESKKHDKTNDVLKSLANNPSNRRRKLRIPDFITATSVDKSLSARFPLRQRMVEPDYSKRTPASELSGQVRDCAEPKALLAAAMAGARVTGMTTFWYSRGKQNEYPDASMPVVGLDVAVPCEFCRVNAPRIMRVVEDAFAGERGMRMPRAFEV